MKNTSTFATFNTNNNHSHSHSQTNTFYTGNNNENGERKSSKFASMRTFNAVKKSWSKIRTRPNSSSKKGKMLNTNKSGGKLEEKGYVPLYTHFSDVRKKGKIYPIRKDNGLMVNTNLSVNMSHERINTLKQGNNEKLVKINKSSTNIHNKGNEMSMRQSDIVNYTSGNNNVSVNIKSKGRNVKKPPAPQSKSNLILPSLKLQKTNHDNNNNTKENGNVINNNKLKQIQNQPNSKQFNHPPNTTETSTTSLPSNQIQPKIQNVNTMSIQSVTYTNFNITSNLKDGIGLTEQPDTSKCVYCLKRVSHPITLLCKHELCLSCAKEFQSLKLFTKHFSSPLSHIKCPQCSTKTPYNDINNLLRKSWKSSNIETNKEENTPKTKIQFCEICPSSKVVRDIAEFECLNCDIVMCYECRIRHLGNNRHIDHKVIQYKKIIQEKIELILCEYNNHKEPFKLYCETCKIPLCVICANYENDHKEHVIKTIRSVLEEQIAQLAIAIRDKETEIKIINELINKMNYSHTNIESEKKIFIEQITKTFNEIYDIIKTQEISLKNNIDILFNDKLNTLNNRITNLTYIKNRYDHYKNLICDRDIDIIERVHMLKLLNKRISKISELNILHSELMNQSLQNSLLINNPLTLIQNALSQYKFLPITDITVSILTKLFSLSTIIKPEMILSDFIVILPKIKSGTLLYKITHDGTSPHTFHEKCDNKGPTLTIVKTDTGHIFGGFNPVSYISESIYSECEDSFIFSLSNGNCVKPIKCPVKIHMKQYAIKQNEGMYSPGFGEIDYADLFISYKNLSKSYSNLGRVYKLPKNENGKTFLAGKESDWKIEDVEVYAIEVISDEEYMKMILN